MPYDPVVLHLDTTTRLVYNIQVCLVRGNGGRYSEKKRTRERECQKQEYARKHASICVKHSKYLLERKSSDDVCERRTKASVRNVKCKTFNIKRLIDRFKQDVFRERTEIIKCSTSCRKAVERERKACQSSLDLR